MEPVVGNIMQETIETEVTYSNFRILDYFALVNSPEKDNMSVSLPSNQHEGGRWFVCNEGNTGGEGVYCAVVVERGRTLQCALK